MIESRRGKVFKKAEARGSLERLASGRYAYTPHGDKRTTLALSFPGLAHTESVDLPAFFEGLAPEGWLLNIATKMRADLAKDRYGLLLAFGGDAMGSVSICPEGDDATEVPNFSNEIVSFEISPTLPDCGELCLGCLQPLRTAEPTAGEYHLACATNLFLASEIALRRYDFSRIESMARKNLEAKLILPGMQAKASLSLEKTSTIGNRLTVAGFGHLGLFILKPQHPEISRFPENEMVMMTLAKRVGLKTAPCGLIRDADRRLHYITRRFDRMPTSQGELIRLAMEDFGQIFGKVRAQEKYNVSTNLIGKTLRKIAPPADAVEFFRQVYFSFLIGNCDLHARNVAVLTEVGVRLTPAFDITSTFLIDGPDEVTSAMLVNGKHSNIRTADWVKLGEACGLTGEQCEKSMTQLETNVLAEVQTLPVPIAHPDWGPLLSTYIRKRIAEREF